MVKKVGNIEITLIPAPKYYINGMVFNEYEIRHLMADVCEGLKPEAIGLIFRDQEGNTFRIREDGTIESLCAGNPHIYGFDFASKEVIRLLRERRIQERKTINNQ